MVTTPHVPFPLRDRIAAALTTACPKHSQCERVGPAVWAVVQAEMEQLRKRAEQAETALEAAEDLAGRQRQDHRAEIAEAEKQIREANATISRLREEFEDRVDTAIAKWVLDQGSDPVPLEQVVAEVEHTGENAEDCPACSGRRDLPYPFICPGTTKES